MMPASDLAALSKRVDDAFNVQFAARPGAAVVTTVTGRRIDLRDFKPIDVDVVDIATGLSRMPRFCGQTPSPYNVAAHSVAVSKLVQALGGGPAAQALGLFHDAAEAYMADVPSPVKALPGMRAYRKMEARIVAAVIEAVPPRMRPTDADAALVKVCDRIALLREYHAFKGGLDALPEFEGVERDFGYSSGGMLAFMHRARELGAA
jgi:hypothetical protein